MRGSFQVFLLHDFFTLRDFTLAHLAERTHPMSSPTYATLTPTTALVNDLRMCVDPAWALPAVKFPFCKNSASGAYRLWSWRSRCSSYEHIVPEQDAAS